MTLLPKHYHAVPVRHYPSDRCNDGGDFIPCPKIFGAPANGLRGSLLRTQAPSLSFAFACR
jgi:hypothetical protein